MNGATEALGAFLFFLLTGMAWLLVIERWPRIERLYGKRSMAKAEAQRAGLKVLLGERYGRVHFGVQLLTSAVMAGFLVGVLALFGWFGLS